MRVPNVTRIVDAILPEDNGTIADDYQMLSNLFYGLGGFIAVETYQYIEKGGAVLGSGTLIQSAAGLALGGAGLYYRERSREAAAEE